MKRLTKAQRAHMLELIDRVNSEENVKPLYVSPLYLDWPIWSAGENMPGYMPDSPYCLFLTERAARGHCRSLEREPGGHDYVSDIMPTTLREILA